MEHHFLMRARWLTSVGVKGVGGTTSELGVARPFLQTLRRRGVGSGHHIASAYGHCGRAVLRVRVAEGLASLSKGDSPCSSHDFASQYR